MNKFNHPNIIKCYEAFEMGGVFYIVLQLCNSDDLFKFVKDNHPNGLEPGLAVHFIKQIISGMKEMRDKGVMHRDIKPQNILVHNSDTIVITDLGFAKEADSTNTYLGTPITMAPEIMKSGSKYSHKVDIWALGVTFYFMFFGDFPWKAKKEELSRVVLEQSGENLPFPPGKEIPPKLKLMLKLMIEPNPDKRLSWEKLFEFNDILNSTLPQQFVASQAMVNKQFMDCQQDSVAVGRHLLLGISEIDKNF